MKKWLRWLFYFVLLAYAAYNLMWLVGIAFSYSKNDSQKELIYLVLTFVVDVPIIWYISKNLKIGAPLFVAALVLSVIDGIVRGWLEATIVAAMWYGPKIIPFTLAIILSRSSPKDKMATAKAG